MSSPYYFGNAEELRRQQVDRKAAADAERKLCLELVSAGYKALAVKCHPDTGGSLADMTRLNAARDRLRRMLAPPPPPRPKPKKRRPKS